MFYISDRRSSFAPSAANWRLRVASGDSYCKEPIVVVTRPLPRDGGIAEDHGAPEARQLPRAWTRGRRERLAKERAAQRVRSWTVQNEMRGDLGRVSAGAAGRILDSADSREIRA